jgi:hypothetical protein
MSEQDRDQGGVDEQPERNEASAAEFKDGQEPLDDGPPDATRDMSINAKRETANAKKETSNGRRDNSFSALKSWSSRLGAVAQKRYTTITLIVAAAIAVAVVGYLVFGRSNILSTPTKTVPSASTQTAQPEKGSKAGPFSVFESQPEQQETEPWLVVAARITLRLALGGLLATLLAFRPRRDSPVTIRNPYVAQTQILLAVVAAALMMIVADNAARAFGIFAAASLVRFRTNIRDPKEITVLLISLAIGLATGVGKTEVAIILALFSLIVVSLLEYYEPEQVFRAMELTVASRRVTETDEILKEIFEKRSMQSELRKVDREDEENPIGKIVYFLNVGADLSTDRLSDEIFAADPENIDSVQWDQKKTSSYVYR